jgi:hypothetical protein
MGKKLKDLKLIPILKLHSMSSWNSINHVKLMIMHKTLKDIQHNINNSKLIHPLNTSRTKNAKDSSLHKFSQIVYFIQMFTIVQLTKLHISFNVFEINGNYREKIITYHCLNILERSSSMEMGQRSMKKPPC